MERATTPMTYTNRVMPLARFTVRSVYGNNTVYPANGPAGLLTKLTGKRTVNETDLRVIRALGFDMMFDGAEDEVQLIVDRMNLVRDSGATS